MSEPEANDAAAQMRNRIIKRAALEFHDGIYGTSVLYLLCIAMHVKCVILLDNLICKVFVNLTLNIFNPQCFASFLFFYLLI